MTKQLPWRIGSFFESMHFAFYDAEGAQNGGVTAVVATIKYWQIAYMADMDAVMQRDG